MSSVEGGVRRRAGAGGARHGRRLAACVVAASLVGAAAPVPIAAQLSPGVHGSWASDSEFGLGARIGVGLHGLAKGLETSGIFDYYFPSDGAAANVADWEASANLFYSLEIEARKLVPYAGAGVGVARYTATVRALETDLKGSETRTGLNLLGGLLFEVGRSIPFLEARVTLGGSEQFALSAGVRF